MALTISKPSSKYDVWGHLKAQIVTVTFDSDLDEAGEAFTPADAGLSEIYAVIPAGLAHDTGTENSFWVHWKSNVLYGVVSTTDFAGDNLDASTYDVTLLVIGV
jgi:hypothetical protein